MIIRTQEYRKKLSKALKGRKHSEEWKRKISESHKGLTHTEETKRKLSEMRQGVHFSTATEFKKGQPAPNKGKIVDKMRDELHPHWKGNEVSYSGLHHWLKRRITKTGYCKRCGCKQARTELARIDKNIGSRELTNYIELCVKCHRNYDAGNISLYDLTQYPL